MVLRRAEEAAINCKLYADNKVEFKPKNELSMLRARNKFHTGRLRAAVVAGIGPDRTHFIETHFSKYKLYNKNQKYNYITRRL